MLAVVWLGSSLRKLPSVVPVFLSIQWLQITAGSYYEFLTGHRVGDFAGMDLRPATALCLTYLVVVFAGVCLGAGRSSIGLARWGLLEQGPDSKGEAGAWRRYAIWLSFGLGAAGLGFALPSLRQPILAIAQLRYVFFLLLLEHLFARRGWGWILALLLFEAGVGFTGFHSEFYAPMILTVALGADLARGWRSRALARMTWSIFLALAAAALVWTGIKTDVRRSWQPDLSRWERFERAASLALDLFGEPRVAVPRALDKLVERAWEIEYPARTLLHVPAVEPHEEGSRLAGALRHVLVPRFVDPSKPNLESDSDLVRRYAGIWVAGSESNTSIGFSYVAESYVDFGVPGMFLPLAGYGLLVGFLFRLYARLLRRPPVRHAAVCVLGAISLRQFEVPWAKVLGSTLMVAVVLLASLKLYEQVQDRRLRHPRART